VVQGVWVGRVLANGGRHARTEPYRGRHRKPGAHLGLGTGTKIAVTLACAALFVCLPQPSWADHAGTVAARTTAVRTTAVRTTTLRQAAARVPGAVRLIWSARLG